MTKTSYPALLTLLALASASFGAQATWSGVGDVLPSGATWSLSTAYTGVGDPDDAFNLSGTPAVDMDTLESALALPAYALDLPGQEFGTEGSALWQSLDLAAGDTLSFDWHFTTQESEFEDHAFVVIGGEVLTLATRTQGLGSGSFTRQFSVGGPVVVGLGVIDTGDYLGVSTLQVLDLRVTPAVPEPATWALWLAGAGLIGLSRRGRRAGG